MNNEFEQSRWFVKIRARIDRDGVHIHERGPFRSYETKIPFHQIPDDLVRVSTMPRLLLGVTTFFGLSLGYRMIQFARGAANASTDSLVWTAILFVLVGANLWAQSGRFVGYLCGTGTLYFFDKKGRQDPSAFLRRIHEAKLEFFSRYRAAAARAGHENEGTRNAPGGLGSSMKLN